MINAQILAALRTFEAASGALSFTRAAAKLNVTTGAVSQQIKHLESQLGFKLFDRLPRGLRLTAEGQQLYAVVHRCLLDLDSCVQRLQHQMLEGHIRFRSTPSLLFKWLVPRLHRFHARYPDIHVETFAEEALLKTEPRDFDLAIDYSFGEYPELEAEKLLPEILFPVASPDYAAGRDWRDPAAWQGLTLLHDSVPWRGAARDAEWRYYLDQIGLGAVESARGHYFNRADLAIEAAAAGLGVALARGSLIDSDLASGRLVAPLPSVDACCAYYLIYRPGALDDVRIRVFFDWLRGLPESAA
ncbi:LysR substrate-binding domain-containing protein [Marinobacterium aestuariivivens]|uniref:LysR substrate-binding domain-containing protein n=1 Tax=Marinobacterium aestuariivivens TaxID=1698799 RepID=A0ABW2A6L9_9GAMM